MVFSSVVRSGKDLGRNLCKHSLYCWVAFAVLNRSASNNVYEVTTALIYFS